MDNWTVELDRWLREGVVLMEFYEKEAGELGRMRTARELVTLQTKMLAVRTTVREEAK